MDTQAVRKKNDTKPLHWFRAKVKTTFLLYHQHGSFTDADARERALSRWKLMPPLKASPALVRCNQFLVLCTALTPQLINNDARRFIVYLLSVQLTRSVNYTSKWAIFISNINAASIIVYAWIVETSTRRRSCPRWYENSLDFCDQPQLLYITCSVNTMQRLFGLACLPPLLLFRCKIPRHYTWNRQLFCHCCMLRATASFVAHLKIGTIYGNIV
jgi:hypothetical protein